MNKFLLFVCLFGLSSNCLAYDIFESSEGIKFARYRYVGESSMSGQMVFSDDEKAHILTYVPKETDFIPIEYPTPDEIALSTNIKAMSPGIASGDILKILGDIKEVKSQIFKYTSILREYLDVEILTGISFNAKIAELYSCLFYLKRHYLKLSK